MSKNFVTTKTKISTITLILALTISAMLFALTTANAHTPPWNIKTYAFLNVAPNPAGVGQTVFVNFFIDKVVPTANVQYGDRWQNFTVTVTTPNDETQTLGPFTSDDVGGAYTTYVPDQVGIYTFVFNFPGQTIEGANPHPIIGTLDPAAVGDYYLPSTSDVVTLTVQQEQVGYYPDTPLPTEYWDRPIYAMNTEWYNISGSWLGQNVDVIGGYAGGGSYDRSQMLESNFNPYTTGPNSAHVVWTKPYAFGGLIGGEFGNAQESSMYYSTAQYETKFAPIIMNGVLYYNLIPGSSRSRQGWVAVDLHTGETIWTKDTTVPLKTGQLMDFVSPNQYGAIPYLWSVEPTVAPNKGATYGMYDAMTGNWILNIVNGSSSGQYSAGFFMRDQMGSLIGYYMNTTDDTLNMWNSTKAIASTFSNTWEWRPPQGASIPWEKGLEWSEPMVTTITAPNGTQINFEEAVIAAAGFPLLGIYTHISRVTDDVIVIDTIDWATFKNPGWAIMEGYSTKTGELLWGPLNHTLPAQSRIWEAGVGDGVMTLYSNALRSWSGYNITTGELIWGPVETPSNAWSYYQGHAMIAYGNLYTADYGGFVNSLDAKTGDLKWTWNTGSSGYETPYGVWPLLNFVAIADGKLYVLGGHVYSPPLFHGARLYCINATSGELIWSALDFGIANHAAAGIADGYLLVSNAYDNQIYAYSKGPSATTVSVPQTAITKGSSVMITGSVIDTSAGTMQDEQSKRFPHGVPAMSDEDMGPWMEYVYMQQPIPADAKGVTVKLTAIDPNGNTQGIGEVTTDMNGNFGKSWKPPVEGDYFIMASFEGSESYWPSYDTSYMVVDPAPTPGQPMETEEPSTAPPTTEEPTTAAPPTTEEPTGVPGEAPLITTEVLIIAAVGVAAVIGVGAYWVLRKRK